VPVLSLTGHLSGWCVPESGP